MKIYVKAATIDKASIQTIKKTLFLYYGIMKDQYANFIYDFDKVAAKEKESDINALSRAQFYKKYLPFVKKCREIETEIEKDFVGHPVDQMIREQMKDLAHEVIISFPYEWAYYLKEETVNASKKITASRENANANKAVLDKIIGKDLWIHAYVHDSRLHSDIGKWIKIQRTVTERGITYYDILTVYDPMKPITEDNTVSRLYRKYDVRPMYPVEILSSDELYEVWQTEVDRILNGED